MELRDDTRGAAIQIGAVLLFAVLIVALSSYQAVVVPEQNRADEFDHSTQVQADLQDVRNAILSTASSGAPQSASVRLGTAFRNRAFLVNPPDPAGRLAVEPGGEIVIENAVGSDTNGYWDGSARSYETAIVSYEPMYREYHNAPVTRYEHSLVYNAFGETAVVTATQRLLAGETISVVGLAGEQRTSHSGTASIDVVPQSAGSEPIRITGDEDPIRLTIPTTHSEIWAEQFADEPRVTVVEEREESIVVELRAEEGGEPIVYELRAAAVGIDTPETRPPAAYLVGEGPKNISEGQPIAVEVRDRYDNPVAGETVSVYHDDERVGEVRANRDGVASYYPGERGEYELRIGEKEYERVSFEVADRGPDDGRTDGNETGRDGPRIDRFTVTDRPGGGKTGIDAHWDVSAGDADLSGRSIRIESDDGTDIRERSAGIGGESDEGRMRFDDLRENAGYAVTLTVTDRGGQNASATKRWEAE